MKYKCHDKILLEDGRQVYVYKDLGNKLECFLEEEVDEIIDSQIYNMSCGNTFIILKTKVIKHIPMKIKWIINDKEIDKKDYLLKIYEKNINN